MNSILLIIISIIIVILLCIVIIYFISVNKSKNNKHIKLLEINSHNSGLVDGLSDYLSESHYEIYRDGYVSAYNLYNKSGKKDEIEYTISIENVTKIEKLLRASIDKPSNLSAFDGTTWNFKYFDQKGHIKGEYNGYIDTYNEFNEILQLLKR